VPVGSVCGAGNGNANAGSAEAPAVSMDARTKVRRDGETFMGDFFLDCF
jgi:hypothetical protein